MMDEKSLELHLKLETRDSAVKDLDGLVMML